MKLNRFERRDNKHSAKNKESRAGIGGSNRHSYRDVNGWGERDEVSAKKALGQHFLIDLSVADAIADILPNGVDAVLEIGPGMGVLTQRLFPRFGERLRCVELDKESVSFLAKQPWADGLSVVSGDFLTLDVTQWISESNSGVLQKIKEQLLPKLAVIGNYPYNISTQIVFKVLECGYPVEYMAGMFQKEVAVRLCAGPGKKDYGITSVLLQAYYDCSYLFDVADACFQPPPKVTSGVMLAKRKEQVPDVEYEALKKVVKMAFGQRRKTLGNALKPLQGEKNKFRLADEFLGKRAEQLSVDDFIRITNEWVSCEK